MRRLWIFAAAVLFLVLGGIVWWEVLHCPNPQPATTEPQELYQCPMHPEYVSSTPGTCGICGMKLVPVHRQQPTDTTAPSTIRIDPRVVQTLGVRTEIVTRRWLDKSIRALGYLSVDESRIATISLKVRGWVEKLFVRTTGDIVPRGAPLLELYSPEVVSAQAEYLQMLSYVERLRQQTADSSTLYAALQGLQAAKRRLQLWDLPEELLIRLEQTRQPQRTVLFRSPFQGVVVERLVTDGMEVRPEMPLMRLADLSSVWVVAEFFPADLPWIRPGQRVAVEIPALPGQRLSGELFFLEPVAQPQVTTVRGRIRLPNPAGVLRPGMYAIVQLRARSATPVLAVPQQAVIRSGTRDIVIRALGNGFFQPVEVHLGAAYDGYYEVLHGLQPGDTIVTSAQFLIDSESNLRAALSQLGHQHGSAPAAPPTPEPHQPETPSPPHQHQQAPPAPHRHSSDQKQPHRAAHAVTCLVCGMQMSADDALAYRWRGKTYYFCDSTELAEFLHQPSRFLQSNPSSP